MFSKRKSNERSCPTKRLCITSDNECDSVFPSASIMESDSDNFRQNKIVLQNPFKVIAEHQKEDGTQKQLDNSKERTVKCPPSEKSIELQELLAAIQNDSQEAEINMYPPGKHTFISTQLFCMFNKDTIPVKHDVSKLHRQGIVLLLSSGGTGRKDILHNMFQNNVWSSHEVNSMYDYIFFLISVHEDEKLVKEGGVLLTGTTSWYPTVDNITKVLINWGASITHNVGAAAGSFKTSDPDPVFKENCKQVLKVIGRKAEQIMKFSTEENQCLLLKNIAECALDIHFIYSDQEMFTECFTLLVNAIPEHQWSPAKVKMICLSLHTREHFHNLHYLCSEILKDYYRCTSLGCCLASHTVQKMLGLDLNKDEIPELLLNSKPFINALNVYQLFIVIQLVFLVTKRQMEVNTNLNLLTIMEWFKDLGIFVKNLPQKTIVDSAVLHELIDRCVAYWRIELINAGIYE